MPKKLGAILSGLSEGTRRPETAGPATLAVAWVVTIGDVFGPPSGN